MRRMITSYARLTCLSVMGATCLFRPVLQDAVPRVGKFFVLFARPGKRVIVDYRGDVVVRPSPHEIHIRNGGNSFPCFCKCAWCVYTVSSRAEVCCFQKFKENLCRVLVKLANGGNGHVKAVNAAWTFAACFCNSDVELNRTIACCRQQSWAPFSCFISEGFHGHLPGSVQQQRLRGELLVSMSCRHMVSCTDLHLTGSLFLSMSKPELAGRP